MAEHIPHPKHPLVRPHDAHHFSLRTDGQGQLVPFREARTPLCTTFSTVCGEGGAVCRGPRPTSSFGSQRELQPARLVIHRTDLCQHNVGNAEGCNRGPASVLLPPVTLAADNGQAPHYQRAPRGGCCLGGGRHSPVRRVSGSEPLRFRTHRHCGRSRPLRSTVVEYQAPTLREDWSCKRALETLCHVWIPTSPQDPTVMSPDLWSKLTWFTSSVGAMISGSNIGYLDRERDRACS